MSGLAVLNRGQVAGSPEQAGDRDSVVEKTSYRSSPSGASSWSNVQRSLQDDSKVLAAGSTLGPNRGCDYTADDRADQCYFERVGHCYAPGQFGIEEQTLPFQGRVAPAGQVYCEFICKDLKVGMPEWSCGKSAQP